MEPTNPYDAPRASLVETRDTGDPDFLWEPRAVPAGNALQWFEAGWGYVMRAPGTWIAIFLLYLVAMMVLSCVPLATNILAPAFAAGVAIGADKLRRGETLAVDALFDGFRTPHTLQVILIGVFTVVASFAFVIVLMPLMLLMPALMGGLEQGGRDAAGFAFLALFVVVVVAIALPLAMATAFAPLLVAFHGIPAFDAMKLSLKGCWINLGGGVVWAVVALVVVVLAALPLLLGLLVAVPLIMATNYAAYRDIWYRG